MAEAIERPVFNEMVLSYDGVSPYTAPSTAFSPAMQCEGDQVTVSMRVIAISGGQLTIYAEGSYDGCAWFSIANTSGNVVGYQENSASAVKFAFVRLRAVLSNTAGWVLFDAAVAFAEI